MDDPVFVGLRLLAVAGLVLANAFFVATEFALVSVRRSRMEQLAQEGNTSAETVLATLEHLDHYIAGTQVGITLASLMLGWMGESALAVLFEQGFAYFDIETTLVSIHTISLAVAFTLITFLHVVLGELVPKSLALQYPDETSLWVSKPMRACVWAMQPMIWALNGTGNAVVRMLGLPVTSGHSNVHSVEELKILMNDSHKQGVLEDEQKVMLHRVFGLKDLVVRQVMVHRLDMVAIEVGADSDSVRALAVERAHSRYPVYEENLDHIVGLLHIKDLIRNDIKPEQFNLRDIVRDSLWVPETLPLEQLLVQLRRARTQVAMVLDEFGGTSGMVTLQDVSEELLGELEDEFDPQEVRLEHDSEGIPVIEGRARLDEVNEAFAIQLVDDEVDTIAGYVIKRLGRVPEVEDSVREGGVSFKVVAMEGRRITSIRLQVESSEKQDGSFPKDPESHE